MKFLLCFRNRNNKIPTRCHRKQRLDHSFIKESPLQWELQHSDTVHGAIDAFKTRTILFKFIDYSRRSGRIPSDSKSIFLWKKKFNRNEVGWMSTKAIFPCPPIVVQIEFSKSNRFSSSSFRYCQCCRN